MAAARSPPQSAPAKSQFFRPTAMPRRAFSARLLSISTRSLHPFVSYGLDSETRPNREEDERPGQTAVPSDSWSAFEATPGERPGGRNQLRRSLRGPGEDGRDRYELEHLIESRLNVIQLIAVEQPRLTVERPMTASIAGRTKALHLVDADVSYPGYDSDLQVPDEHLLDYIDGKRRNLLVATRLEEEVGGFAPTHLDPLNPFERGPNEFTASAPDLSSLMVYLRNLVQRLHQICPDLAVAEAAANIILSLDEDAWETRLERDFLTESRPFRGLVETRRVKALAALRRAAAKGEAWAWAWAWNDFLGQ